MSDINTYINQSRQKGMTDEQIRQELLKTGRKEEDINSSFYQNTFFKMLWRSWGKFYLRNFVIKIIVTGIFILILIIGMTWSFLSR